MTKPKIKKQSVADRISEKIRKFRKNSLTKSTKYLVSAFSDALEVETAIINAAHGSVTTPKRQVTTSKSFVNKRNSLVYSSNDGFSFMYANEATKDLYRSFVDLRLLLENIPLGTLPDSKVIFSFFEFKCSDIRKCFFLQELTHRVRSYRNYLKNSRIVTFHEANNFPKHRDRTDSVFRILPEIVIGSQSSEEILVPSHHYENYELIKKRLSKWSNIVLRKLVTRTIQSDNLKRIASVFVKEVLLTTEVLQTFIGQNSERESIIPMNTVNMTNIKKHRTPTRESIALRPSHSAVFIL